MIANREIFRFQNDSSLQWCRILYDKLCTTLLFNETMGDDDGIFSIFFRQFDLFFSFFHHHMYRTNMIGKKKKWKQKYFCLHSNRQKRVFFFFLDCCFKRMDERKSSKKEKHPHIPTSLRRNRSFKKCFIQERDIDRSTAAEFPAVNESDGCTYLYKNYRCKWRRNTCPFFNTPFKWYIGYKNYRTVNLEKVWQSY